MGHLPDLEDLAPELVTGWASKDAPGLLDLLLDEAARWCERHMPRVRATDQVFDHGSLDHDYLGGSIYLSRRDARRELLEVRLRGPRPGGAALLRLTFNARTPGRADGRPWRLVTSAPWEEITPSLLCEWSHDRPVAPAQFHALERGGIDWTIERTP